MTSDGDRPPLRGRRGNYSVLMGGTMLILCGFAALGVDVSLMTMAEMQAQSTADAAAHAALVVYRQNQDMDAARAAAAFIVAHDKVAMGYATLAPGSPEFGTYDFDQAAFSPGLSDLGNANSARVELHRTGDNAVGLLFAPILGFNEFEVTAEAITAQQMRAIMLIQDMSGSMMGTTSSAAVNQSRLANQVFLTYLRDHPQDGDLLGLAMFAQLAVAAPTSTRPQGSATSSATVAPWAPLMDVHAMYQTLEDRIDGICNTTSGQPCPLSGNYHPVQSDIGNCTNPAPAILQAVNELSTKTDETYFRGIVFMSDGLPNCNRFGSDDSTAGSRAVSAVNQAWNNDINVWTILFHNGSFDTSFMSSLPRGVGFAQTSSDATDLSRMYEEVAQSLPLALVH